MKVRSLLKFFFHPVPLLCQKRLSKCIWVCLYKALLVPHNQVIMNYFLLLSHELLKLTFEGFYFFGRFKAQYAGFLDERLFFEAHY